jgi:hypothetical protein
MFGGFFIARVITARVNDYKEIFALYFGTGSGDAHPHEETAFTIALYDRKRSSWSFTGLQQRCQDVLWETFFCHFRITK